MRGPSMASSGRVPDRFVAPRVFHSLADAPPSRVVAVAIAGLATSWLVSLLAGEERSGVRHLFYLPILIIAVRFGARSAVLTAVTAGLLAGPLLPSGAAGGDEQSTSGWVTRLVMFVVVALMVAWMTGVTRPVLLLSGGDAKISAQLRTALRRGELTVYYQPQVDLSSGEIVGVEALVRWQHPTRGLLLPAEFICAAERTGFVREIDNFVLTEAARQLATWTAAGYDRLTLAVNVSAQRFHDEALVPDIARQLEASALDPSRLHLEITETVIVSEHDSVARQLADLRHLGVRIAIDDFGVGQTSLSHLHRYTVDYVKIDRMFVSTLDDPKVRRLVAGMIMLIDALDLVAIGEGIATEEDCLRMMALHCPIGQGFHFAEPGDSALTKLRLDRARNAREAMGAPESGPARIDGP